MAKLTLSIDGIVLKEIPLDKARTTIGRKPHNDVQIDNLAVSGEHAVIVTVRKDAFLEDLGSTNGTQVNGQPITKHFLQNGDVIELGKYRLKYLKETEQEADQADFEKTMIIRPDRVPKPAEQSSEKAMLPPAKEPALASPPPALPRGAIQIIFGVNAGKELELTKTITSLGKPGVQVAVIARRPHGYFITHVEGAVFPSVNGKLLDAQPHPLHDHDVIEMAGTKMEFFLKA